VFTDIQGWFAAGREVVLAGASVFLLIAVIGIGIMKRSLIASFATLLFGALLLWGMVNSDLLRDKAGEDFGAADVVTDVSDVVAR
jgi:hypothetical protein